MESIAQKSKSLDLICDKTQIRINLFVGLFASTKLCRSVNHYESYKIMVDIYYLTISSF